MYSQYIQNRFTKCAKYMAYSHVPGKHHDIYICIHVLQELGLTCFIAVFYLQYIQMTLAHTCITKTESH